MSVDIATVKRVARLARIAVSEEDAERMTGELNTILGFVEQLNEVDVTGVEPMTSVIPMEMKKRQDVVTDGDKAADIVANAPATDENFKLPPEGVNFEDVERSLIMQAMDRTDNNITKSAKLLGLTFRTLQYRLEKYGIKRDGDEGSDE